MHVFCSNYNLYVTFIICSCIIWLTNSLSGVVFLGLSVKLCWLSVIERYRFKVMMNYRVDIRLCQ
jgi:urocanate hydratase